MADGWRIGCAEADTIGMLGTVMKLMPRGVLTARCDADPAMRRLRDGGAVGEVFLADKVPFEDPVGSARSHGPDAFRTHSKEAVAATTRKTPGDPVGARTRPTS